VSRRKRRNNGGGGGTGALNEAAARRNQWHRKSITDNGVLACVHRWRVGGAASRASVPRSLRCRSAARGRRLLRRIARAPHTLRTQQRSDAKAGEIERRTKALSAGLKLARHAHCLLWNSVPRRGLRARVVWWSSVGVRTHAPAACCRLTARCRRSVLRKCCIKRASSAKILRGFAACAARSFCALLPSGMDRRGRPSRRRTLYPAGIPLRNGCGGSANGWNGWDAWRMVGRAARSPVALPACYLASLVGVCASRRMAALNFRTAFDGKRGGARALLAHAWLQVFASAAW